MAFSLDTFNVIDIPGYGDYVINMLCTYFVYLFETGLVGSGMTASIGLSNRLPIKSNNDVKQ